MLITPRPAGEAPHPVPSLLTSAVPMLSQGGTAPPAPPSLSTHRPSWGDQVWLGLTDQGCDGRGENRAALHHEGHPSAHHHGEVPSEPAERVREVCHCMAMGTGMDTSMDTSAGRSPELLHGAGEGAVGPGSVYGVRLWVWGQPGARWPGWLGKAKMCTRGGHDSHKQSGDPGQAGDTGVQAGMGVRGSQGWV